jgi:hypothetical protein
MQIQIWKVAVGFAALGVLAGLGFVAYQAAGRGLVTCGNDIMKEIHSPDGRYTAAFYERNCGATVDYSSIVSLRPSEARLGSGQDERALVVRGRCSLGLQWEDSATLRVSYPRNCLVFERRDSSHGVRITFDEH